MDMFGKWEEFRELLRFSVNVKIWKHPKNGKTYEVPIDVHRDFENMVEV